MLYIQRETLEGLAEWHACRDPGRHQAAAVLMLRLSGAGLQESFHLIRSQGGERANTKKHSHCCLPAASSALKVERQRERRGGWQSEGEVGER